MKIIGNLLLAVGIAYAAIVVLGVTVGIIAQIL